MSKEERKKLVLYMPVLHKGYVDFFSVNKNKIDTVYIIDKSFVSKLSKFEPDIASLDTKYVKDILSFLNIKVEILFEDSVDKLKTEKLLLINDAVSRKLSNLYFADSDVVWHSVFLRWDQDSVVAEEPCDVQTTDAEPQVLFIKNAYEEAKNSSDWWRQVGAVLVKNEDILLRAYNRALPTDTEPYQHGAIRDFLEVGEKPELSSTIHAEQLIIAKAAREGLSLENASLYVTHFPCTVCAKLIVFSGIKECFFAEGSSNGRGKEIMEQAKVTLTKVSYLVEKK